MACPARFIWANGSFIFKVSFPDEIPQSQFRSLVVVSSPFLIKATIRQDKLSQAKLLRRHEGALPKATTHAYDTPYFAASWAWNKPVYSLACSLACTSPTIDAHLESAAHLQIPHELLNCPGDEVGRGGS